MSHVNIVCEATKLEMRLNMKTKRQCRGKRRLSLGTVSMLISENTFYNEQ